MLKLIFSSEFVSYIKQHSDLWIGYFISLFGGTGGVSLIIGSALWDFVGVIGGIMLTVCSIALTIMLTIKAWYGMQKIKEDIKRAANQDEILNKKG